MTGRKNRALQVPHVVQYKALGKLSKAFYETTGGTCGARFFRPVILDPPQLSVICSADFQTVFSKFSAESQPAICRDANDNLSLPISQYL